jgi:aryl-alcohol dehydrogenase-like predicted oxidoreductase
MDKYLQIKDTDLKVCRIGMGTVNAGLSWEGQDAFNILEAYVNDGGNLIDTARIYSDWVEPEIGRSERVIGDWIRHRGGRRDLVILTKFGHPDFSSMNTGRLSHREIEYDIALSLEKLGIDCIDIYCFHRDDVSRPVSELIEEMESLVKAGKIRYYACSNWTVDRMMEADAYCARKGYRGFVLNEALFNMGTKYAKPFPDPTLVKADEKMLAYHAANERNILAPYSGLCNGFFHKLIEQGEDAVRDMPYFSDGNLKIMEKIKELTKKYGCGISQVLLGFILTRTPGMIPLMSVGSLGHLDEALNTFRIDFQAEDFM